MSTSVTIEPRSGYILVTLPPNHELTAQGLEEFWPALLAVCRERKCTKVLSVGPKPTRRMSVMDAYNSGIQATQDLAGLQVAHCWEGYVPDGLTRFFQAVASNRGASVEFFPDVATGRAWLGLPANDAG